MASGTARLRGGVACRDIPAPHPGQSRRGCGQLSERRAGLSSVPGSPCCRGGAGCAIPPELPQCRDVPAPPAGLPAGPRTSAGSGYKAQAAEHPSPGSSPRRASSRRQPPAGAEMFYSGILTEPSRKEVEIREAASLRQQRRMKQAVQFIHKDSADLLPLDGLKKLGTSKDTVRFCCVYWK